MMSNDRTPEKTWVDIMREKATKKQQERNRIANVENRIMIEDNIAKLSDSVPSLRHTIVGRLNRGDSTSILFHQNDDTLVCPFVRKEHMRMPVRDGCAMEDVRVRIQHVCDSLQARAKQEGMTGVTFTMSDKAQGNPLGDGINTMIYAHF